MQEYKTKKDSIYEILKEEIYDCKYKFGEKLVISHLAKRFNTSEIPVREALNQLSADDLIEFKPHVGAVVKPLSPKDIRNIFELRIELEGLATRLAAEHLEEEHFKQLRAILDESKDAFKEKDYARFETLNVDFHMGIYRHSDNQLLVKTIEELWKNTRRYPSLFNQNDEHIKLSIQEHEDIFNALFRKDGTLAENIMLKHKARAGKEILRITQHDFYMNLTDSS